MLRFVIVAWKLNRFHLANENHMLYAIQLCRIQHVQSIKHKS